MSSSVVKFRLPVKGSFIALRVMNSYGVPRSEKGLIVKSKSNQTPIKYSHWCYGKVIEDPQYTEDCVVVDLHLRDVIDYKDQIVHRKQQKLTFDTYGKVCSIDKRRVDVWYVMDRPTYESFMGQDTLSTKADIVTLTNKDCPIATYAVMTSKTVDEELACVHCNNCDATHKQYGVMYICSNCDKGYHKGCLERDKKPIPASDEECEEDWLCWQCCTPTQRKSSTPPHRPQPPVNNNTGPQEQKRQKTQHSKIQMQQTDADMTRCHGCEKSFKLNPDTCRVVSANEKYCSMCTKYGV